jgi:hypothetical protein
MIDRPVHSVNVGQAPSGTDVSRFDMSRFEGSADNVTRWGGDRHRYLASLAAGLATDPTLDQGQTRDLAAIAAWRAGVIGLRTAALGALDRLADHSPAVGAVLGLPVVQVPHFAVGQVTDRFFWPPWTAGSAYLIARVGGFVGLGGPWLAPPQSVTAVGPGRWGVTADGSTWNVDIDLFGHSITQGDPSQSLTDERVTATLRTSATSYLLDVVREPS